MEDMGYTGVATRCQEDPRGGRVDPRGCRRFAICATSKVRGGNAYNLIEGSKAVEEEGNGIELEGMRNPHLLVGQASGGYAYPPRCTRSMPRRSQISFRVRLRGGNARAARQYRGVDRGDDDRGVCVCVSVSIFLLPPRFLNTHTPARERTGKERATVSDLREVQGDAGRQ